MIRRQILMPSFRLRIEVIKICLRIDMFLKIGAHIRGGQFCDGKPQGNEFVDIGKHYNNQLKFYL
jgi:hypothetical protein